jgi:carbonic anhydrase/acetyltransferase-like protein (isoleucine patch superfamily)
MLYALGSRKVQLIGSGHYVAPNATIIGDVVLESESSIWFNVVIRGDNDTITIERDRTSRTVGAAHRRRRALTLGPSVSVGHLVMLHGARSARAR